MTKYKSVYQKIRRRIVIVAIRVLWIDSGGKDLREGKPESMFYGTVEGLKQGRGHSIGEEGRSDVFGQPLDGDKAGGTSWLPLSPTSRFPGLSLLDTIHVCLSALAGYPSELLPIAI